MSANTQGITRSDLEEAYRIFDEDGVSRSRIRFHYDEATDQWCIADADTNMCVAKRNPPPNAIEWVRM